MPSPSACSESTWIVGNQLSLGNDRIIGSGTQTLVLGVATEDKGDVERMSRAIAASPHVERVVRSSAAPGELGFMNMFSPSSARGEEAVEGESSAMLRTIAADTDYADFYGIDLAAGRALTPGDQRAIYSTGGASRPSASEKSQPMR